MPFLYEQKHKPKLICMNDKKILMTLIALSLLALPRLMLTVSVAQESPERIVGVRVGDWVKYGDFLATYESDDPSAQTPPADLVEHNNTEWVRSTVESISGTKITFQTVTHYKNGTDMSSTLYVDINTGDGEGAHMFISANLTALDNIYNSTEYDDTWINGTDPIVYANALNGRGDISV